MSRLNLDYYGKPKSAGRPFRPIVGLLSSSVRKRRPVQWRKVSRCSPVVAGHQRLVNMSFVTSGYWSTCAPL
ncbi:unnamed protein product, partial [Schistosoma curassoni]